MSTPMFEVPEHLPMPVNANGQGPVEEAEAESWTCWCGNPACPLSIALWEAGQAGKRAYIRDLRPRLERAANRLEENKTGARFLEEARLGGKIEGVKLALSYIHEEKVR